MAREIRVLMVEDNPGDVELFRDQLDGASVRCSLIVARDGVEALAMLHQEPGFEQVARPDLILLDLNLPKKDGREVLAELKEDPSLRSIPVIVLSSSDAEADVATSYALNANCYIAKPVDLESLIEVVRTIDRFWFRLAKLPPRRT
jgi:CheY-like chemotaxis protein